MSYNELLEFLRDMLIFKETLLNEDETYPTYSHGAGQSTPWDARFIIGDDNISFNIYFVKEPISPPCVMMINMSKCIGDQIYEPVENITHFNSPSNLKAI
jgi:hypothetical protein